MIGATLYLTFHLQIVLGMGALEAGVASLPLPLGTMVLAGLATKMLGKIGPRPMLIGGPLIVAAALIYLSFIMPGGNYLVQVAPALLVMGMGMAFVFIPLQNVALTGVAPHDAGVASSVTNSVRFPLPELVRFPLPELVEGSESARRRHASEAMSEALRTV